MNCNHWAGKTAAFLGDSITDGVGTAPGTRYLDVLGRMVGLNAHGYGVNGARFAGLYDQAQRMAAELGPDVDAVFLLAGTNDYMGSVPLGEWFSESDAPVVCRTDSDGAPLAQSMRKHRTALMDPSTFRGSINMVLDFLKHRYAQKQIILMTPIHRAYACFGETNIQPDERYANALGLYIDDYTAVVREASRLWATELIDLESASGLFPLYDESAVYFANPDLNQLHPDRLHPGAAGHMRMAQVIAAKLGGIAVF